MAENGRREVVGDPLSLNVAQQAPVRDLPLTGVRNPGQTGGDAVYRDQMGVLDALGGLGNALSGVLAAKEDEWVTEGQLQYMQGATEEHIAQTGNKWTMQGWQSLHTADAANRWYADELVNITNGGRELAPEEYGKLLMQKRAQFMEQLPDDPAVRKMYVAAFSDIGPRLTAQQTSAHNDYNLEQTELGLRNYGASSSATAFDAPKFDGNSPIALSNGMVRTTINYNDAEVDRLTRMMLGEAGGEGATGMAAVAHVAVNRAIDGAFGGQSLMGVLTETQFNGLKGSERYDQNSIAYQRARGIAVDVLSGHMVDPTNGRTHFVSGGIRPAWWASEEAKGNIITIGGHEFVGSARNLGVGNSTATGALKFAHDDQKDINPQFATILSNSAVQLGIDLDINSGHRTAEHNAAIGGAEGSRHVKGDAVDIDMSKMNEEERSNLVRTLRANGAQRFSVYSNTNHLHVDMSTEQGGNWFMYDETNDKLGDAPAWFQAVSREPVNAGQQNVAVSNETNAQAVTDGLGVPTAQSVSIAQTQVQDFWRGYSAPRPMKAKVLSELLVEELSAGNDALWNNVGGLAFLQEMGGSPTQMRQVQTARENYEKEQANNYNEQQTEAEFNLIQDVQDGKLTLEDAKTQIAEWKTASTWGPNSDTTATNLLNKVLAADNIADGNAPLEPGDRRAIEDIYRGIRRQELTAEEAQARIEAMPLDNATAQRYIEQMWAEERGTTDRLETAAAAAAEKQKKDQVIMDTVNQMIANGNGLEGVTGTLSNGISAKDYAVGVIKARAMTSAADAKEIYRASGMDEATASAAAEAAANTMVHEQLYKQGIIDSAVQRSMTSAATGIVLDSSGNPKGSTLQEFDRYMQMVANPNLGQAYADQYLSTPESKALFSTAAALMGSTTDIDRAMEAAVKMRDSGAEYANVALGTVSAGIGENRQEIMKAISPEMLSMPTGYSMGNFDSIVQAKANALATLTPWEPVTSVVKRAATEVAKDTFLVGGNLMYGDKSKGQRLDTMMGLEGYDRTAPDKAIQDYISTFMQDPSNGWQEVVNKQQPNVFQYAFSRIGNYSESDYWDPKAPITIEYLPEQGVAYAHLWENPEKTIPARVPPIRMELDAVGAAWIEKNRPQEGTLDSLVNTMIDWTDKPSTVTQTTLPPLPMTAAPGVVGFDMMAPAQ